MSKTTLSSGDELSDLRIRVKRLEREKDSLQERLRLEKRDHEATKADWNEDLLVAKQTIDALNTKLNEALDEAQLEREERGRVEQRLRAEMFDRSEVSAVSTPENNKRSLDEVDEELDDTSSTKRRRVQEDQEIVRGQDGMEDSTMEQGGDKQGNQVRTEDIDKPGEARLDRDAEETEEGDEESEDDSDYVFPHPQWVTEGVREICQEYPGSLFDIVASFGKAGKLSEPQWMIQCTDCPPALYQICEADYPHSNAPVVDVHVQDQEHRRRVNERMARQQEEEMKTIRSILQKLFFVDPTGLRSEDVAQSDELFKQVEQFDMTVRCLSYSKIGKVMRHIAHLDVTKIPDEDKDGFRQRAQTLVTKWQGKLHAPEPVAGPSGSTNAQKARPAADGAATTSAAGPCGDVAMSGV